MAFGGRDYVETSRRRSASMRRQKRERLEGRDATDQPGPSSVATSLSIDTDLADEGDSSAPMDTSDSSKSDGSESAMLARRHPGVKQRRFGKHCTGSRQVWLV